ncbi:hypothetical protein [Streptomyces sp. NPDC058953]|uniref:hypothetical protein n=1 Tax=Streptomyces sp. NPDC058953 TaxID=3346676 RepID=UPI0036BAD6FF
MTTNPLGWNGVRQAVDALGCWRLKEWPVVARLAGEVGPLVRGALVSSGVWESLPGHTRAAVHWCAADAREIGRTWPVDVDAEAYGPGITALCMDAAHFAALYDPRGAGRWPEADPDRAEHALLAVDTARQWGDLPASWRAAVLRDLYHPERPTLTETLAAATTYAEKGEPPPPPDYIHLRTVDAPELAHRIRRLPHDWRPEAFRRIATGTDPLTVETEARRAIRTGV